MGDYKVVSSLAVALQWCMLAASDQITSKTFFCSPVITSGRLIASFQWLSSSIMRDEQMNDGSFCTRHDGICSSFAGFKLKQLLLRVQKLFHPLRILEHWMKYRFVELLRARRRRTVTVISIWNCNSTW